MKIATVNVNGIRAAFKKGMSQWLEESQVDVVLAQETRAPASVVAELFGSDWETVTSPCRIAGRAGVAVAVRGRSPWAITESRLEPVPIMHPADSGRWIEVDLVSKETSTTSAGKKLTVASVYLHSGEVGTEKQDLKMSHLERVDSYLAAQSEENILVAGDFNIVHQECDIKNWKPNHNKRAGVLDEEIAYLDRWFTGKWNDITRQLVGEQPGPYSWWSWRGKAFDNDAGWRIDYQMASAPLAKLARQVYVDRASTYDKRFSDHAPVVVEYDI